MDKALRHGIPSPRREVDDDVDSDLSPDEVVSPDEVADAPAPPSLTDRELEILAFEKQSWRHAGAKEQAIRDRFDLSATRYYQLLNALLDNPLALEHEPVLVGRLRRLRGSRARARSRR
ncbi:DUF3263 domain-containing protein [Allorhizocola rhizosphaerae]|uniref:DUF3263 domain-containing protein n=1 Tax=Allorhizocola rhizosphaerae TaxID=1872709 RepID=UPI001FE53A0B|nr:DUF3263 domain-containing protein [Allorhizocola rhizosphaerae]